MSQPTLTQQIGQLEKDLGLKLFDRTRRPIRLTSAGQALLPRVSAILGQAHAIRADIPRLKAQERDELKVGATSAVSGLMPGLLARFAEQYPQVSLTLREGLTSDLIRLVQEGELSVALVLSSGARSHGGRRLMAEMLFPFEFVFAVALDHPLAERRGIRLADLRDERFVLSTGISGTAMLKALNGAGLAPATVYETNDGATSLQLVAKGLGIGLTSDLRIRQSGLNLRALDIADGSFSNSVTVIWPRAMDSNGAPRQFLDFVRTYDWTS